MSKLKEMQKRSEKLQAEIKAAEEAELIDDIKWKHATYDVKGNAKPILHRENTEILFNKSGVSVRFNRMTREPDIEFPTSFLFDENINNSAIGELKDIARLSAYPAACVDEHLDTIGGQNSYHPASEWIDSVEWDGVDRFNELFTSMGVESDKKLAKILLRRWALSAIAALYRKTEYNVQFHAEGVLVFVGKQGRGKTKWMTSLAPEDMVREGLSLRLDNKDDLFKANSVWISELGELDATFKKTDISQLKGFITSRGEELRKPYAKASEYMARRSVFVATVNDTEFLSDDENRRFYCVSIGEDINPNHGINMQQFWSQMLVEWKDGETVINFDGEKEFMTPAPHWTQPIERKMLDSSNKNYAVTDPIQQMFTDLVFNPMNETVDSNRAGIYVNATTLTQYLLGNQNRGNIIKVSKLLKNGFEMNNTDNKRLFLVGIRRIHNSEAYEELVNSSKAVDAPHFDIKDGQIFIS